jgi:nucleotide sugar dehydrogenase
MISIIGIGVVGNAMYDSFKLKNIDTIIYDKYKNIGKIDDCLKTKIIFLALPTLYNKNKCEYNKDELIEICNFFEQKTYNGVIIIKSTVEPETTNNLSKVYKSLNLIHNPEFLTAQTAFEDFHNQKHIILGKSDNCSNDSFDNAYNFYKQNYSDAFISVCSSTESESAKIFCNSFYAVKIQFFTELFLTCESNGSNFEKIKQLMLLNNWINPMHTNVPGTDGNISYGGMCFPKDINALCQYMKKKNVLHDVICSAINERNVLRND